VARVQASHAGDGATPWRRFWSRQLDLLFGGLLVTLPLGLLWPSLFDPDGPMSGRIGARMLGWLTLPAVMVLDAVMYSVFGNTLGKKIGGIKVVGTNDAPVRFREYVRRNFGVYWSGLGTGFPLISLIALLRSYERAKHDERLPWDASVGTRVVAVSKRPVRTWVVGTACTIAEILGLVGYFLP
jgi:uncharacterized RDD family membrane protein YckC